MKRPNDTAKPVGVEHRIADLRGALRDARSPDLRQLLQEMLVRQHELRSSLAPAAVT